MPHPFPLLHRILRGRARCVLRRVWALAVCAAHGAAAQADPQDATLPVAVPFDLRFHEAGALVDLRFLNHRPAGQFGRVRAQGDQLVWPDGTQARFWGVNLQANALFRTEDADIQRHARRLARLGVNLVRIHHHDSDWVSLNIFGPRDRRRMELDLHAMGRIDLWIAALKAEGIYIWLDLHVGRLLGHETPGIDHVEEVLAGRVSGDLRGFNFINPSIKREMQRVAEAYLTHINRYTGLAYKDDPAIAVVLISNENDLVKHFANRLLPNKPAPRHSATFMAEARAFARRHGFSPGEIWKAWEDGPPKMFLADLEHAFFEDMIAHLRGLGYEGLVATSSFWGGLDMAGLASLSLGDVIDVHSYAPDGALSRPPWQAEWQADDLFTPMAAAHLSGKPFTISEWNLEPFPARERGIAALHMAALAGFQGWDAPILYGYAQGSLTRRRTAGNWHAAPDPTLIGALPAAALLFRARQIRPAETVYAYRPDDRSFFDSTAWGRDKGRLRTLLERHGLQTVLPEVAQLPWLTPVPAPYPNSVEATVLPATTNMVLSDTGEIKRVLGDGPGIGPGIGPEPEGTLLIDSPFAQIAAGAISEKTTQLSKARFQLDQPATIIAVQSLAQEPLREAKRLLISLVAPATPTETGRFEGPGISGSLRFQAHPDLVVAGRAPTTAQGRIIHKKAGSWHEIEVANLPATTWLILALP